MTWSSRYICVPSSDSILRRAPVPIAFSFGSAFADENGLLAVALAVNGSGNSFLAVWIERFGVLEMFDDDRGSIRHFLAGLDQNAFADQLGNHEAQRLVSVLVGGIVALAPGQDVDDFAEQHVEAVALARAHGDDLGELVLARERFDEGKKLIFADQIDFGKDEEDRAIELAHQGEEKFVLGARGAVGAFSFLDRIHWDRESQVARGA